MHMFKGHTILLYISKSYFVKNISEFLYLMIPGFFYRRWLIDVQRKQIIAAGVMVAHPKKRMRGVF
jgi:hypothetical protein